jgi:hypothetical protein
MAELSLMDKIGLCGIALLGKGIAEAAFLLTHPTVKTKNRASLGVMVSRWHHSPQAEEFIKSARAGTATVNPPDEDNDLSSRAGIIDALITATRQTQGKDSVAALQTLAKIQGLDRPQERETEDLRRFFVAFKSDCRRCALMKLYREIQDKKKSYE